MEKVKVPHTFVIISFIIVVVAIATWIIPAGEFDTVEDAQGKSVIVAESFHQVKSNPQGISSIFLAPVKGLIDAASIVAFILIVGGAFSVIYKTGAIDAMIVKTVKLLSGKEIIIIPTVMLLFSAGGAVFGMSEETIPFVMLFVPLSLAMGYDSIIGVAMPFVGAGLGFAGAMFNPFTVGIAQGIAELPPFSGVGYRTLCWAIITVVGIGFVMLYARKIKKKPESSPMYEIDKKYKEEHLKRHNEDVELRRSHKVVVVIFIFGMITLIVGVMKWGWYIKEICALFTAVGIIAGVAGRISANEIAKGFIKGAEDLCAAALVVGLARGILIVAKDGKIIDTILYYLSNLASGLSGIMSAWVMFFVQTCINFFVPSGSGQAALTMPIMAPLGDLIDVPRQIIILAYQFGDGFTNLIIPTSGVLLGCLFIAKIPWEKWAKWILPLQLFLIIIGCILLAGAVIIGFGS